MHAKAFDLASRPCLFRGSERPPTQAIPGRLFAARAKAYRAMPSVTLRQPGRLDCARHSPRSRALLAGAKIKKPLHADSASLHRRSPFALLRVGLDGRRFFDFRSGAVAPARERATERIYGALGRAFDTLRTAVRSPARNQPNPLGRMRAGFPVPCWTLGTRDRTGQRALGRPYALGPLGRAILPKARA